MPYFLMPFSIISSGMNILRVSTRVFSIRSRTVILPDAPLRQIISFYLSYIPLLSARGGASRNDGEATILIHLSLSGSRCCLPHRYDDLAARLAERKGTVAQTLCLLHNPVLILQILWLENSAHSSRQDTHRTSPCRAVSPECLHGYCGRCRHPSHHEAGNRA